MVLFLVENLVNNMLYYPLKDSVITSPFGGTRNHNGTDYRATEGTKIFAPQDGKITALYTGTKGGKQLIIEHPNGFTTGYAHLSNYNVKIGETVTNGQVIAFTGNTGVGSGPHLHFTVSIDGRKIDPETVLKKRTIATGISSNLKDNKGFAFLIIFILTIISILIYTNYVRNK